MSDATQAATMHEGVGAAPLDNSNRYVNAEAMLGEERALIVDRRRNAGLGEIVSAPAGWDKRPYAGQGMVGLALSGGGIRSATFCLGILQYLANKGLLKHVDYLSTVSGGGYIGSALTWFLHGNHGLGVNDDTGRPYGVGADDFPFGSESPLHSAPYAGNKRLTHLRNRGKYLTPGDGITLVSGIAVVLRGIILNLLVWVPLVSALMLGLTEAIGLTKNRLSSTVVSMCETLVEPMVRLALGQEWCEAPTTDEAMLLYAIFFVFLCFLSIGCALFIVACVVYSVVAYKPFRMDDAGRYKFRRKFEIAAGHLLIWFIALPAVLASLPLVHQWIAAKGAMSLIAGGGLSGVWSFMRIGGNSDEKSWISTDVIAAIGAALFLYGFGLLSFSIAVGTMTADNPCYWLIGLAISVVTAFASGFWVNINLIGLHRFYRDRLMEAFMPDKDTSANHMAIEADKAMIQSMTRRGPNAKGPYHLVNTNLITVRTRDRTRRIRGGDSFVISPLYCGSNATGWYASPNYLHGSMSMATAMSISGAAANPNAGSGGAGATRSAPIAILMSLLNIRLGYFVPNPDPKIYKQTCWTKRAHHFVPGFTAAMSAVIGSGNDEERPWLQLSDGGHFDNSGLYELFRRRVKLAIACDGSADPGYAFSDMLLALERARLDFGIRWKIDGDTPLANMVPQEDSHFPMDGKCAPLGYMVAQFWYPDDPVPGLLIYMTTTLIKSLDEHILGYRAENADFPDQSTGDQFFDDRQFEAYRVLGWCIAEQMAENTKISPSANGAYLTVERAKGSDTVQQVKP